MIDIWDFSLLRILFRICQEQDTQKKIYEQRKQRQQYWISQFFLISLSTTIERGGTRKKQIRAAGDKNSSRRGVKRAAKQRRKSLETRNHRTKQKIYDNTQKNLISWHLKRQKQAQRDQQRRRLSTKQQFKSTRLDFSPPHENS